MRALKFLVIAMGVVIIGGFALVAFEVIRRGGEGVEPPVAATAPAGEPFVSTLELPEGSQFVGMAVAGDRLVINVRLPDDKGRVFFIDPATGEVVGTLTVTAAE